MANVIKKAVNKFTKGLIMDFSPENTQDEMLTNALNATLLTFNGNELSLQNDMGNARVETAYLPEGYIPVGTCEYGGIIYIVSYNPLEDKSLIGCFPSPERNISSDELGEPNLKIEYNYFHDTSTGKIKHKSYCVTLKQDKLNPGDKFIVCSSANIYEENLVDLLVKENELFKFKANPKIALNVVSIEESGKIVYLNSDLLQYELDHTIENETNTYKYHILGKITDNPLEQSIDIDDYRNVLQSGYSVFKSKTSGRLALLAELVTIDSYSVTHSIQPIKRSVDYTPLQGNYEIIIHTDVTASVPNNTNILKTNDNFNLLPKLKYYYLQNSQGYIPVGNINDKDSQSNQYIKKDNGTYLIPLFEIDDNYNALPTYNPNFLEHSLSDIYKLDESDGNGIVDSELSKVSIFNFPKPHSYYGRMESYNGDINEIPENIQIYTKFTGKKYHRVHRDQFVVVENIDTGDGNFVESIVNRDKYLYFTLELSAKFYYYQSNSVNTPVDEELSELETYYVKIPSIVYIDIERDELYRDNTDLYKLTSVLTQAKKELLYDSTIEKFIYDETDSYIPLLDPTTYEGDIFVQLTVDGKFIYTKFQGTEFDSDTIYYEHQSIRYIKSIGFDYNQEYLLVYYFKETSQYEEAKDEDIIKYWDTVTYPNNPPFKLFILDSTSHETYVEATIEDRKKYESGDLQLFKKDHYVEIVNFDENEIMFMRLQNDAYVPITNFEPNEDWNYIAGLSETDEWDEKGDPIYIYKIADFIPESPVVNTENTLLNYEDVVLATIKIPDTLTENSLDLLFKYDYTIVPCMDYGILDWLAVSNTIDFSNLHNFDLSNFNTWKYRIDGNQLRLTFGADIYDTFIDENSDKSKVDALVLEFYDLWGFAGSIEISNKKSYSGLFTKLISLNTLGALSTKKITGTEENGVIIGEYSEYYHRNLGIVKLPPEDATLEEDLQKAIFKFNNRNITRDPNYGWYYTEPKDDVAEMSEGREYIESDCGTLYSNLVYGVKTYLRQTTSSGLYVFTPKKDFFLYTIPIYNEYYHTKNNFSELGNPYLKFALTYKIVDESSIKVYSDGNIREGYHLSDYEKVLEYKSGIYNDNNLDLVRYYTYEGTSNLLLEIGLLPEYLNLGLTCLPDINNYFQCNLKLYSDDDSSKTFGVKSSEKGDTSEILNYTWNAENILSYDNLNKLGFGKNKDLEYSINSNFDAHNFLYENSLKSPIPINYTFTVGYLVNIDNIRKTQVPATTVCALCHKNDYGEYNYEDFGIYNYNGAFYSKAMFFNEGTASTEVFGLCRQISTTGTMGELCAKEFFEQRDSEVITENTKFNSGQTLKNLLPHIGKLTFCLPHAHGFSADNGVNILEGYIIGPMISDTEDDTYFNNNTSGTVPTNYLYENPRYNLSLNTKMMMNYAGNFISTIDYNTLPAKILCGYKKKNKEPLYVGTGNTAATYDKAPEFTSRVYTGITGVELLLFNARLIETMKSVYAYNPDYDFIQVSLGNVNNLDRLVQFISNLCADESKLEFTNRLDNINDFICIHGTKFDKYLELLEYHSNISTNTEQVQFKADLTYCGSDTPILLSTLTYNTSAPSNLKDDLSFSLDDLIVVRHHDNRRTFINGTLDKRCLYGFNNDYNKLVQLDVVNYTILTSTGELVLNSKVKTLLYDTEDQMLSGNVLEEQLRYFIELGGSSTGIKVSANLNISSAISTEDDSKKYVYVVLDNNLDTFSINPSITLNTDNGGSYLAKVLDMNGHVLYVTLPKGYLEALQGYNVDKLSKIFAGDVVDGIDWANIREPQINLSNGVIENEYNLSKTSELIALIYIELDSISFKIDKYMDIANVLDDVILLDKTYNFSEIKAYKYLIKEEYKQACFSGTNLTINDLVYEPNNTGHRLYVRDDCYKYNNSPRAKIYYRTMSIDGTYREEVDTSWLYYDTKSNGVEYKGTPNLNSIFLQTGPCFVLNSIK